MPNNLQAIRSLRLERDTLRSRVAAILDDNDAAWDGRSDRDQERRLETAQSVSEALCAVEAALDVELDRLLRGVEPNGSTGPRLVVHCAAGRFVPGEAIATEGGGFRNIASMMPVAVLRDHIANLRDLISKAEDPATMDELSGRLEVAVDEELARAAGQPSPKPVPRPVAAAPVQHRGEGLALMVGGPTASAGGGMQIGRSGRFSDMKDFAHEPGIAFARLAKLCAVSRGNSFEAMHHAKAMYPTDTRIFAALQQGVATGGGFLCPEDQAREMVTLLRSRTVVRGNARVLPMRGTLTMPVQTSGVAATWLGESIDITSSDVTFGQRRLVAHKLCAMVAASNELIRNSSPEADSFIREELVAALSSAEDLAFIRGDGVGATPKGLRFWALTANVNNGTGTSAAQIEADLIAMAARLSTGMKGNLQSPRWLMTSRTYYKIYSLRDATNGELLFPEIRNNPPRLLNHPVDVTDLILINLSPGTGTEIMLIEFNSVLVGEDLAISVAVSDVASYMTPGSTLVSAFSRDETVLRAVLSVDMVVARDEAVQVLTGAAVTY